MKLFSEEVKSTSTNSSHNVLSVESFDEIFFDVFEIELNESKYPVERVGNYQGSPVVNVPIVVEGEERLYPFVLQKGKLKVFFNENNTEPPSEEQTILSHLPPVSDTKQEILEQISNALTLAEQSVTVYEQQKRLEAEEKIKAYKDKELLEAREEVQRNKRIVKKTLDNAKKELLKEFLTISSKIKEEIVDETFEKYSDLDGVLNEKITTASKELKESFKNNFEDCSILFETKIKTLVKDLYSTTVLPKVDKELREIATDIVEKVQTIKLDLDSKLIDKASNTLVEEISKGLSKEMGVIRDANIELNNNINKGVNKALSRAGNVKNLVEKLASDVDSKIQTTEESIKDYYDEKLKLLKEEQLDLTDAAREYYLNLISESREKLLNEIQGLKGSDITPVEYILEDKKGGLPTSKSYKDIEREWNKTIKKMFDEQRMDMRKYIAVYASGGGTNATQYQDGGEMFGNLTIHGTISASNYAGISGGSGGPSTDTLQDVTDRGATTTHGISVSSLSSSSITLTPLSASPTYKEGSIYYDQGTHTLAYMNDNADVRVNIGEESLIRCRNASGVLIPNGQAVKIIGAQGNRPRIIKATSENNQFTNHSNEIIGVATHDISHTEDGYVTTEGIVRGIDLSLFSEGDTLYLQIDGTLNTTYPPIPYDKILVGYVTVAGNNGQMFVSPIPPIHINDISGLSATPPANGDIFSYNSTLSTFINGNNISVTSLSAQSATMTGDINFTDIGEGIIIKSPDATRWRITINNFGALQATSL